MGGPTAHHPRAHVYPPVGMADCMAQHWRSVINAKEDSEIAAAAAAVAGTGGGLSESIHGLSSIGVSRYISYFT